MNLIVSNTSVLSISSVNATENGGTYECVAFNGTVYGVAQSLMYVRPFIVEQPQDQLIKSEDLPIITLRIRAESFPYPLYQWQKYFVQSQSYENIEGETGMEIVEFISVNFLYRCRVETPTINSTIFSNTPEIIGL